MIWSRQLGSSEAIAKALGTSGLHCRLVQMIRLITVLSIEMTISDGSVQIAVCLFCNIALFFSQCPTDGRIGCDVNGISNTYSNPNNSDRGCYIKLGASHP